MSFCPKCGKRVVEEGSSFCAYCGAGLPEFEEGSGAAPAEEEAVPAAAANGKADGSREEQAEEAPADGEFAAAGPGEAYVEESGELEETVEVPAEETPTKVIPAAQIAASLPPRKPEHADAGASDTEPTTTMPAQGEPTAVMPAAPSDEGSAGGDDGGPPAGKSGKKKFLLYAGITLLAAAAIAGGVIGIMELTGDSGATPETKTVVKTKTVRVDPEAEPLDEPFTLTVDLLDGSIPDDLVEMEYLLAEIELDVDNGDVYGMARRTATAADGTSIQGAETTLEVKGTYKNGNLKADWNFYGPFGTADIHADGNLESAGDITKEEAACLLDGEFVTVTGEGEGDTRELDEIVVYFDIS